MKRKMKKSLKIFATVTGAVLMLAGCSPKKMTSEALFAAAMKKAVDAKSMNAEMTMEMTMEAVGQTFDSTTVMNMTYFKKPMHMKAEMEMEMTGTGKMNMDMYVVQDDSGECTMYMYDGDAWSKDTVNLEDIGQFDASSMIKMYTENKLEFKAEDEADGIIKYSTIVSGDDIKKVFESTGYFKSFESMGISKETIENMTEDMGEMPVSVWVDRKQVYPVKYEMDMSEPMSKIMDYMMNEMAGELSFNIQVEISKMSMSMECFNYNAAEDFEIPKEALK